MCCSCITWFLGSPGSQSHQNRAKASQYHAQPSPWSQALGKKQHHTAKSVCHSKDAGSFSSGNPEALASVSLSSGGRSNSRHWPLLLPGTAVGWEAPPGKKAPAMSFLAYYKESKIYQIENSYYYRDMLTKRNSIKLPQNIKHPAQRAAFIHLLRVYVGAEIYSVSHKHSVPLLLKGMSAGSSGQGRL